MNGWIKILTFNIFPKEIKIIPDTPITEINHKNHIGTPSSRDISPYFQELIVGFIIEKSRKQKIKKVKIFVKNFRNFTNLIEIILSIRSTNISFSLLITILIPNTIVIKRKIPTRSYAPIIGKLNNALNNTSATIINIIITKEIDEIYFGNIQNNKKILTFKTQNIIRFWKLIDYIKKLTQ